MKQQIWVEIGESEAEKDKMLMELEKECLQIYQRKVDEAANSKARLHQSVAAMEAEVASLMAALGVLNINSPVPPIFMISFDCPSNYIKLIPIELCVLILR